MMTSRSFRKWHMVAGAMLTVLIVAGCGAEAESAAESSASPSDEATSAAASPSPSPSSSPTSEPASSTSGEPEGSGANEGDYESCGDGACEVSFSGSVEFPLSGADGEWTVAAAVEEHGVDVDLTQPTGLGGGGGLLYQPGCNLVIRADGGGSLSCEAPPEPDSGGIVVHLLELNGENAVIEVALG